MLIILETFNRILQEACVTTFKRKVDGDPNVEGNKKEVLPMSVNLCDFDGSKLQCVIDPDNLKEMIVSLFIPCYKNLNALGVSERLKKTYGALVQATPVKGFDVTLKINLETLGPDYPKLADSLSNLKFVAFGAPYYTFLEALVAGKKINSGQVVVSEDTTVYLVSKADRVVVVFSLNFMDKFDEVLARVFCNSLKEESKKKGEAPNCTFDVAPPPDLKTEFGVQDAVGNVGFVTMVLLPHHVKTPEKVDKAVGLLQNFRTYLGYHIKCSKTYFHTKMRAEVKSMLDVLNRAKTEEDTKKKKTASGRTFERK